MAMRAPGFISTPFALSGDKTEIPKVVQPSGAISMPQGWGPDYGKELGVDPAAKPVDRFAENWLNYAVTQLLNRWQLEGAPEWISPADNGGIAVAYPTGASVLVFDTNGKRNVWMNKLETDNNQAPPTAAGVTDGNGWTIIATYLGGYLVLNTASLQTVTGPVTFNNTTRSAGPAINVTPDTQLANTNYVTRGRALSHPSSITYGQSGIFIAPTMAGNPAVGRYCRQWGITRSPQPSPTEQDLSWTIYFPTAFVTAPLVTLTAHSTNYYSDLAIARISAITSSYFICRVTNTNAQALQLPIGVNWTADGVVAASI